MIDQLERRIWIAETRTLRLEQASEQPRQTNIQNLQDLAQLWGIVAMTPTCSVTLSGTIIGCSGRGVPSVGIEVFDFLSPTTSYGTTTTNGSGVWSLVVTLPGPTTSLTVTATPGDPSFSVKSVNFTSNTFTCGGSASGFGFTLVVAAGYHCGPLSCAYPLPDTLTLTDSQYGAVTLTYRAANANCAGQPAGWHGTTTGASYPGGCCTCAADTGIQIDYYLSNGSGNECVFNQSLVITGLTVITYGRSTSASCPKNFVPINAFSRIGVAFSSSTPTTLACPPSLSAVWSFAAPGSGAGRYCLYCAGTTTLTITP